MIRPEWYVILSGRFPSVPDEDDSRAFRLNQHICEQQV